ncbi:MAG: hypothetical protein INH41_25530 [Myxococcaceae bacterium]|jgi:hypothetical protein|nr:hypothetical protein [Myxococcaceae bacterium]MCA3015762.1 hypothetical protein [Myxococcaceae bacterium]
MTRPFVVLVAVVSMLGCGEATPLVTAPPKHEPFLMLAAVYVTPCATNFERIARGKDFGVSVGQLDATGTRVEPVEASFGLTDAAGAAVAFELPRQGTLVTRFARAGRYELTATLADGATLRQDLEVVEQAGLRLSPVYRRVTTHAAAGDCADTQSGVYAGPGPVSLALNQALETSVVPCDAEGVPLLGAVEFELSSGELNVSKSTTWLGPNSYRFEPTRAGRGVVHVTDRATGQRAELEFDVTADAATCPAQQ